MKKHKKKKFACIYKRSLELMGIALGLGLGSCFVMTWIYGNYVFCTSAYWHDDFKVWSPIMMTDGTFSLFADFFAVVVFIIWSYDWAKENC